MDKWFPVEKVTKKGGQNVSKRLKKSLYFNANESI